MTEQYQIVSYFGRADTADDKVFDGNDWTDFWRNAKPYSEDEADKLVRTLQGHKPKATLGKQRYYPW